ncbi:MAG TPA: RdgB/HAM1 family non-canonical purine NTP pyrophosphatase [Anaerolineales bacterium]|nr:RdgB/HAM1 family non-canonical purine NTP pyrophosphatase [Anaerolineales bacterium]
MRSLLIGSLNRGKQAEFNALLSGLDLQVVFPQAFFLELEIEETGIDYTENAQIKAQAFARASRMWTLADDTGLEVEALGGEPGRYSRRIAGPGQTDADRRRFLLDRLKPHPRLWVARFCCAAVLASPGGEVFRAEGSCLGEIIPDERGTGGFGYDPIFLVQGLDRTMAELSMAEKNSISHRARAVKAILPVLRQQLGLV